jgi:hypothetical protein
MPSGLHANHLYAGVAKYQICGTARKNRRLALQLSNYDVGFFQSANLPASHTNLVARDKGDLHAVFSFNKGRCDALDN